MRAFFDSTHYVFTNLSQPSLGESSEKTQKNEYKSYLTNKKFV